MRRLTEFLSKPVISLYEGKTEGTIKNVIFSKTLKKIKWLVLFNDKDMLEQKFLPASAIYSVGENAVVIKNNQEITPNIANENEQKQNNPINYPLYTITGKFEDTVTDVLFDDKNTVALLELKSGKQLTLSDIVVNGHDSLILQDANNPINIKSFKKKNFPKVDKEKATQKVKALSAETSNFNSDESDENTTSDIIKEDNFIKGENNRNNMQNQNEKINKPEQPKPEVKLKPNPTQKSSEEESKTDKPKINEEKVKANKVENNLPKTETKVEDKKPETTTKQPEQVKKLANKTKSEQQPKASTKPKQKPKAQPQSKEKEQTKTNNKSASKPKKQANNKTKQTKNEQKPKANKKPQQKATPKANNQKETTQPKYNKSKKTSSGQATNENNTTKNSLVDLPIFPDQITDKQPNEDCQSFEITKGIDEANEKLSNAKKDLIAKKNDLTKQIGLIKKQVKLANKQKKNVKPKKQIIPKTKKQIEEYKNTQKQIEEKQKKKKKKTYVFNQNTAKPNRVIGQKNFLLNRTSQKNIYTINKELIVKQGEILTQAVIDKALICGKLPELIKFSK